MNYIELINAFWNKSESDNISGSDIVVYMALLKYCNKLNWLNPFVCHWDIVCQYSKVSKNTFYKSMDILNEKGYIKFEKGVKNSSIKPKVFILKFENKEGTIQEQFGNKEGLKLEQKGNLYKLLNNQTIKLLNDNSSIVNSNLEKWINSEKSFNKSLEEKEKKVAPKKENSHQDYIDELKISTEWLNVMSMQNNYITIENIISKLDDFNAHLNTDFKIHQSKSEFVNHFKNWLKKIPEKKELEIQHNR